MSVRFLLSASRNPDLHGLGTRPDPARAHGTVPGWFGVPAAWQAGDVSHEAVAVPPALAEEGSVSAEVDNVSELAEPQGDPDHGEEQPAAAAPVSAEAVGTESPAQAPDEPLPPPDEEARWAPLRLAVVPEIVAEFDWFATTGSVETYEHRVTFRFVHVDGLTGEFLDQQRNVITAEAAMRYARPAPPAVEPIPAAAATPHAQPITQPAAPPPVQQAEATTDGEDTREPDPASPSGGDLVVGNFMRREDRLARPGPRAEPEARDGIAGDEAAEAARGALPSRLLRLVSGVRNRLRPSQDAAAEEGEGPESGTGMARFTRGGFTPGGE